MSDTLFRVRILVCALEAPLPPVNGLRLQLAALIAELRKQHDVRVLGFRMPDQVDSTADKSLRLVSPPGRRPLERGVSLARSIVARQPRGTIERAARLRGPLREELECFRPDVVHVASGKLAMLGNDLAGWPSILAALDAWHLNHEAQARVARGVRRRLLRWEVGRIRRYEATRYRRFSRVVVVSLEDRAALHDLDPELRIEVIPNGVDCERFAPDPSVQVDPNRIIFTGVMSYAPNVTSAELLARRVLPMVRAVHGSAHLSIVGRAPRPEVVALGRIEGVEVIGEVPSVVPWLNGSRVYACPMLSGTGIKNKVLEALACGIPTVATPLALQGTGVRHGREALIGAGHEELAEHLIAVLRDDELAGSLGHAGRAYVMANHSWESVGRAYERLYGQVGARTASGSAPARARSRRMRP